MEQMDGGLVTYVVIVNVFSVVELNTVAYELHLGWINSSCVSNIELNAFNGAQCVTREGNSLLIEDIYINLNLWCAKNS